MDRLIAKVKILYEQDAIHVKRGFRLRTEGSISVASNHLIEEAVELQAELLWGKREAIVEEAGDLLTLFCHILKRTDISLDEVVNSTELKWLSVLRWVMALVFTSVLMITWTQRNCQDIS